MMQEYTKYNAETGEVEYTFSGTPEDAALNTPNIEGHYPSEEYTVVNGVAVRKSDAEIAQRQDEFAWLGFKNKRNGYLSDSDWTQAIDSPLTDDKKQEWATYRQALRDLPENTTDPRNPLWPTKPDL